MTVLAFLVFYILMGSLVCFGVQYIAYRNDWCEVNREAFPILAWIFWPLAGPVFMLSAIYRLMNEKAKELAYRKYKKKP